MWAEGQMVGNYQLLRKLGEGAFGEVWAVKHTELDAVRAMKIPTDPDCVKQLRKEGKIQFELKHPNIVETVDLNTHHDPPYYVMEYVEGEDLRKVLTARGKLPVPDALHLLHQILDALRTAHAHGVLHRDLKPENVLVTADGTVKVTDFGLGKVQSAVAQSLMLSGSMTSVEGKSVSGTYAYMSPEQQMGKESDPRDDVYAMGIIACELLTGNRPSGVGVAKIFKRAGIDAVLSEIVEKALDEPAQRYASAGEMLDALARIERRAAPSRVGPAKLSAPVQPRPPALPKKEPAEDVPTLESVPTPERKATRSQVPDLNRAAPRAGQAPGVGVPGRFGWIRSPGERAAKGWLIAAAFMILVALAPFASESNQDEDTAQGCLAAAAIVWIGSTIAVARARNRQLLACAETCLASGDHVVGLACARKMRRGGVDGSRARAAIEGLAALAEQRGDAAGARELGLLAQGWVLIPAAGRKWTGSSARVPVPPETAPQAKAFGESRLGVILAVAAGLLGLVLLSGRDTELHAIALMGVAPAAAILYGWLTCRGGQAFWVSILLDALFGAFASVESSGRRPIFRGSDDWVILMSIAVAGGICGAVAAAIRRYRRRRKGLPPM